MIRVACFFKITMKYRVAVVLIADVAFIFQDMEELKREESLTSDSSLISTDMNQTQPCEYVVYLHQDLL